MLVPMPLAIAVLPSLLVSLAAEIVTGGGVPVAFIVPVWPVALWAVFTLAVAAFIGRRTRAQAKRRRENFLRVMQGSQPYGGWTLPAAREEWTVARGTKAVTQAWK